MYNVSHQSTQIKGLEMSYFTVLYKNKRYENKKAKLRVSLV